MNHRSHSGLHLGPHVPLLAHSHAHIHTHTHTHTYTQTHARMHTHTDTHFTLQAHHIIEVMCSDNSHKCDCYLDHYPQ